jgi:hypothetical protein
MVDAAPGLWVAEGVLFRTLNAIETAAQVSLQNLVPDVGEETRRQHAIVIAVWLCAGQRPRIGAGPKKIIGFRHDDP